MTKTAISAPKTLMDGKLHENQTIIIENGIIKEISSPENVPKDIPIEANEKGILLPGFIDIQVNGGSGILFNDNPSVQAIKDIGKAHRAFGTTAFMPTLISDDLSKIKDAIEAVEEAIQKGVPGVIGIHIEGPFLNPAKCGIHNRDKFMSLNADHIPLLTSLKSGKTLLTLAPELAARDLIKTLSEKGVILSVGHTMASYEETWAGIEAGITGFTHLFNAMPQFESRAPGPIGAAFNLRETYASFIADGFHLHPESLKHAIMTKGIDRSILITDAMPSVGATVKNFTLDGALITEKEGKLTNEAGTLAGSDLDMAKALKYTITMLDLTLEDASRMASLTPAEFLRLDQMSGSIKVGKHANLVHLSDDLEVLGVWIKGEKEKTIKPLRCE